MSKKTVIVDYGVGNIKSISNAVIKCGSDVILSNDYNTISHASQIILPGVGAFGESMKKLKQLKLDEAIQEANLNNVKLLGICLGMQFFFEKSYEFGEHNGLGLIHGEVCRLTSNSEKNKILPNIGWHKLEEENLSLKKSMISREILLKNHYYFVHSFAVTSLNNNLSYTTSNYYDKKFISFFNYKNITGCQFHPEKSGASGLNLLKHWIEI